LLNSPTIIGFHNDNFATRYEAVIDQDLDRLVNPAVQLYDRTRGEFENIFEGQLVLAERDTEGNSNPSSKSIVREAGAVSPVCRDPSRSVFLGALAWPAGRRQRRTQAEQYGSKSDGEWW
jgi:hypothetical protein